MRKHGVSSFTVGVLCSGVPKGFALAVERAAIVALGTQVPAGYNLTSGGESPEFSDETRERLSTVKRGVPKSRDHVEKQAAAQRGKRLTPEHIERIRRQATGRKASDETRAKQSAATKGRPKSEETKARMRKPKTAQHLANIQAAKAAKRALTF